MTADTSSVSYSMVGFSSSMSYGTAASEADSAAAGRSNNATPTGQMPPAMNPTMGPLASALFGLFENILNKGGHGFDAGPAGGSQSGASTNASASSSPNTLSPTNSKGEVSSDPADVRQLLKSLFGRLIDYSCGETNHQKSNPNKETPASAKGCQGGQTGCNESAGADDTKPATNDEEAGDKKAKKKAKELKPEDDYKVDNFKEHYREYCSEHYTDHTVMHEIDPATGIDSITDNSFDTKNKTVDSDEAATKTDVSDDGKTASVELGGHKFTFNKNESKITIDGGANIYGDPHLKNKDGSEAALFKKDTQVKLADGTKMYVHVTDAQGNPWTKDTQGQTYVNRIALESPNGKMAFIDNISQANNKKMTAEALDAKPGNFADVAVKMADFKPASQLSLDKEASTWKDKEGNALNQEKMSATEA